MCGVLGVKEYLGEILEENICLQTKLTGIRRGIYRNQDREQQTVGQSWRWSVKSGVQWRIMLQIDKRKCVTFKMV